MVEVGFQYRKERAQPYITYGLRLAYSEYCSIFFFDFLLAWMYSSRRCKAITNARFLITDSNNRYITSTQNHFETKHRSPRLLWIDPCTADVFTKGEDHL